MGGTPSKKESADVSRRLSTSSAKSDHSEKKKNHKEQTRNGHPRATRRTIEIKSNVPLNTPITIPARALEVHVSNGSNSRKSSPSPVIVKPVKPKSGTNPTPKTNTTKPAWGAATPRKTTSATTTAGETASAAASSKARNPDGNVTRRPRANGTIKAASTTPASHRNSTPAAASTPNSLAGQKAEILRLQSLCQSRTEELTLAKIQHRDTARAFDAMSVLVNYCSTEMDAFKKQLADCMAQITELEQNKGNLTSQLQKSDKEKETQTERANKAEAQAKQDKAEYVRLTRELEGTHDAALTTQRDTLTGQHQKAVASLHEQHEKHVERLKQYHERKTSDVKNECKMEVNALKISHLEEIQELRNKHDAQMEELHKQHRNKLEDITQRFESIKLTLSEKVESLRGECEELGQRAKNSEEALQRDADVKVQMAIAPFMNLPKEVESLKTVVEMRNEEIQRLRTKNMDLEKQLEEIPIGREKIISLQQKIENLEAIINIKTDHEKQLHEKCQVLMRKYDKESRANKTLSMEHEQVLWRMSQSAEFGSSDSLGGSLTTSMTSLPGSPGLGGAGGSRRHTRGGGEGLRTSTSPDSRLSTSPMRRSFHAGEEVQMRVKKNRASASSSGHRKSTGGAGGRRGDMEERKMRARSATFVVERGEDIDGSSSSGSGTGGCADEDGTHSLSSSPRTAAINSGNLCHLSQSAGAVIHYELPYIHGKKDASREDGEEDESGAPLVVAAACTSTPRGGNDQWDDSTEMKGSTDFVVREDEIVVTGGDGSTVVMTASMLSSCTRSISSGVSDSGVYDSMTRSELLNSSMVSTDSEWGVSNSNNASMTLDSTLDLDDPESRSGGPRTRDFSSINDVTLVPRGTVSSASTSSAAHTYSQQVSVQDDVFDEEMSMETCSFASNGKGQGHQTRYDPNSMTSSSASVDIGDDDDDDDDDDGGFTVTCSDTVTDLAGACLEPRM